MDRSIRSVSAATAAGVLIAALIGLTPGRCRAQVIVSGGLESFRWTEDTSPRRVEEHGPLGSIHIGWTQRSSQPVRIAYRSRYYLGWVGYRGSYLFAADSAARGTSGYMGMAQEGQMRARVGPVLDAYGGLGVELWRRSLAGGALEDFNVTYARVGIGTNPARQSSWTIDTGAKFVLDANEDAHLTDLGFARNPTLKPRGLVSGFAQLGLRLRGDWMVQAYMDGYRFKQSASVPVARNRRNEEIVVYQPGSQLSVIGLKLARHF